MKKDFHDKRTGCIGEHRIPELLKLIEEGKTALQIADLFDINSETIRKFARKRNISITRHDQTMENHPAWKNGKIFDVNGYEFQRVKLDGVYGYLIRALHKRGKRGHDMSGYAATHRIVMHNKLNRQLRKGEVVDHIDGNKLNNHPDNLRVFESNAEHLRVTLKGKKPKWTEQGFSNMKAKRQPKPKDEISRMLATRLKNRLLKLGAP